jgi:hypothetical protein
MGPTPPASSASMRCSSALIRSAMLAFRRWIRLLIYSSVLQN